MNTFTVDETPVAVVLGEFRMSVGRRTFSGRDAVIWVEPIDRGQQRLFRIEVYIEGAARVVEPGGTTTEDQSLFVTLLIQGRVRAEVATQDTRSLADLPLMNRAVAMRRTVRDRAGAPPAVTRPQTPASPAQPAGPDEPVQVETPDQPAVAVEPEPQPVIPVSYRADEVISQMHNAQRVLICRGSVYLSQGTPATGTIMELRSDAAVLYMREEEDQAAAPEMAVEGMPGQIQLDGVYLTGDVVLTHGTQTIRGTQLYFDFRANRAIILDMVMRTIHRWRTIPIYVRAEEARILSRREMWFRDARVSTSEFYTPSYHIGGTRAYLMDTTPRDEFTGLALGETSYHVQLDNATFNVRGMPISWWPRLAADAQTTDSPLIRAQLGRAGNFGWGAESQWFLFRLLGLIEPEGFRGKLNLDWYERAMGAGVDIEYTRDQFSGFIIAYGVKDLEQEDSFGRDNENIPAPEYRGRLLWRHRQILPEDWTVQAELSSICDENYLREFFSDEYWNGKDQDTLIYARKQVDNWAFTALLQGQPNHWQQGQNAAPDLGAVILGEPIADGAANVFAEAHAGYLWYDDGNDPNVPASHGLTRLDTRAEIDAPLHWGPLNVLPFAFGRLSYWDQGIGETAVGRAFGGGGVRANLHIWRVYNGVDSRIWDIHRLRHVITPEVIGYAGATNVGPDVLYPFSPDIEQHVDSFQAVAFGLRQRWQTYRGVGEDRHVVDWFRMNTYVALFNDPKDKTLPSHGQMFFSRPEYSLTHNAVYGDLTWNLSDSTAVLGDFNVDLDDGYLAVANLGLAVQRDPRLRYYVGHRYTRDLDSSVLTAGLSYQLSSKYTLQAFEQYDFDFDGSDNLRTEVTLIRKWPRWFTAVTVVIDRSEDEYGVVLTLWPEGIPEVRVGTTRLGGSSFSDLN